MYELYHAHYSTCSQKVRLALAEKETDFTSHIIELALQQHLTPEYLALNPNGVVPTLIHGEEVIVDSSVICEYLDEIILEKKLSPPSASGRAKMRAWMCYFEEVPTTAIRIPSFNKLFAKSLGQAPKEFFDNMTSKMPLRKHFYQKMNGVEGFDQSAYDESLERFSSTITRMDKSLNASGPWIMGQQFTIADIVVIPSFVRMEDLGLSELWCNAPSVGRWYQAVQDRPSFAKAFYKGARVGLPKPNTD